MIMPSGWVSLGEVRRWEYKQNEKDNLQKKRSWRGRFIYYCNITECGCHHIWVLISHDVGATISGY